VCRSKGRLGEANKPFKNVTKFEHFRPVQTDEKAVVVLADTKRD
jgi:hypothetical protein